MGIAIELTGEPIGGMAWIEDRGVVLPENGIVKGPRIGVDYAGEDALLPYRFHILNNLWVSKRS